MVKDVKLDVYDVNMLIVVYTVESDSYRVQSDSSMVKRDLNGWLEPKCGTILTCMKVELRGGKRMSNWM